MSVKALPAAMIVAAVVWGGGLGTITVSAAPLSLDRAVIPTSTVTLASFWGRPYPYGYAYRRPRAECYATRRVRGRHGWHWHRILVCGTGVVTSRY